MKGVITRNPGLKISSLLISILLWFFVTSRGLSEMSFEVPLEFRNIPAGLGIINSSNKTATLNIQGQERLMKNLRPSEIRVSVDMGRAKKGEGVFYVNKDDIKLPFTMTISSVTPSSVKVRMDETASVVVPVAPIIEGRPAKGFEVVSVTSEPKTLTIHGLKSELRRLTGIKTEAVDLTGLRETVSQDADIEMPGANFRADLSAVKVTVVIKETKK